VGEAIGAPSDWLNDAAKGYFAGEVPQQDVLNLPNLRVWAPTAEYMLAMKCISARFDTFDRDDVVFLIKHLQLRSTAAALAIIVRFYPHHLVPPKTQFLLEELFDPSSAN